MESEIDLAKKSSGLTIDKRGDITGMMRRREITMTCRSKAERKLSFAADTTGNRGD